MSWYDPRSWFNQTAVVETPVTTYETTPTLPGGRKKRNKTRRGGRKASKKSRGGKKSNRT